MIKKSLKIVMATTRDLGIGFKNDLPWPKLSKDLKALKELTSQSSSQANSTKPAIIYGFKTLTSMGGRPLPNRANLVITSKSKQQLTEFHNPNLHFFGSLDEAVQFSNTSEQISDTSILGGAQIYDQLFKNHENYDISCLYWTRIFKSFPCDVHINKEYLDSFLAHAKHSLISKTIVEHGDINYDVSMFSKHPILKPLPIQLEKSEEYQYLTLLDELIKSGHDRPDRTNTGVKGLFGKLMRFDLSQSFPLLTTKSVFFRGVLEELLWFLKGNTNAKDLSDKGVSIWDGNGSREFLDSRGLNHYQEGDLGPVYGFQWRHFGADYKGFDADYTGQGRDQIQQLMDDLKRDKFSRRHILSAWNPVDSHKMALPPCHILSQFYVTNDDKLNCALFQRSADIGLGVPFNIASYSLLVCMIADLLGLKRGEFVHFIGDAHVYLNHIEPLKKQIQRIPNAFPVLEIIKKNDKVNLWDYESEEFVVKNYFAHGKLKMKMAV